MGRIAMREVRQAVVWGCVGWLAACPYYPPNSNAFPLAFGMSPEAAAAALNVPLTPLTGRRGSEVYYAQLPSGIPSLLGLNAYDRQLWLQFRRGRLTGWKNNWGRLIW
jgi:hypothetical protein